MLRTPAPLIGALGIKNEAVLYCQECRYRYIYRNSVISRSDIFRISDRLFTLRRKEWIPICWRRRGAGNARGLQHRCADAGIQFRRRGVARISDYNQPLPSGLPRNSDCNRGYLHALDFEVIVLRRQASV